MQPFAKTKYSSLLAFVCIFLCCFLAYLPVSTFLFFIKNDAFTNYFPAKYFISESIQAGHLPLWNPYINYGIPQYADMNAGYYSPITWLIASTIGYNAYSFTIENLLYLFTGGWAMFHLIRYFKCSFTTALIAGFTYTCCGFNIGNLQHTNWISAAAFLPAFLLVYLKLLDKFSVKHLIAAILVLYFLVASAHPGIIIASLYFFATIGIFHLMHNRNSNRNIPFKQFFTAHILLIIGFCLLAIGLMVGYADILPYFIRGEKVSLTDSLLYPTTLPSWISLLLPMSTTQNAGLFQTDISMRNVYMGLTIFIFLISALVGKKTSWQKLFLWLGLSFALLSLGGIFKTFAYNFIPYIGYVRLNGEFRIFALLATVIVGAIQLEKFLSSSNPPPLSIKKIIVVLQLLTLSLVIFAVGKLILGDGFFFQHLTGTANGLTGKLKFIVDKIGFYDAIWIQGIVQLILLQVIKNGIFKKNQRLLILAVAADLIIASLLNLPFTGVGKASVATIQQVLNEAPKGIPIPANKPTGATSSIPKENQEMIGDWSFYNKEIGTKREIPYPIVLNNMRAYFEEIEKGNHQYLDSPYVFIENNRIANHFEVTKFTGNEMLININAADTGKLILQQNYYPHWKENEKFKPSLEGKNFMSFPIQKGEQQLHIQFDPKAVKATLLVSLVVFILLGLTYVFLLLKPVFLSSRQQPLDP